MLGLVSVIRVVVCDIISTCYFNLFNPKIKPFAISYTFFLSIYLNLTVRDSFVYV